MQGAADRYLPGEDEWGVGRSAPQRELKLGGRKRDWGAMDSRLVARTYPRLMQVPLVQLDSVTFGSFVMKNSLGVAPVSWGPRKTSHWAGERNYDAAR